MTRWDETDRLAAACYAHIFYVHSGGSKLMLMRRWKKLAVDRDGFRDRWRDAVKNAIRPEEFFARCCASTDDKLFYSMVAQWKGLSKRHRRKWTEALVACIIRRESDTIRRC